MKESELDRALSNGARKRKAAQPPVEIHYTGKPSKRNGAMLRLTEQAESMTKEYLFQRNEIIFLGEEYGRATVFRERGQNKIFSYREDQGDDVNNWAFCRWLPHVWSESRKFRYVASNKSEASDMFYELMSVLRMRGEQDHSDPSHPPVKPWYILAIEDSAVLENEPIAKFLLDVKRDYGITTLLLADKAEDLPNACECVISQMDDTFTMYHTRETDTEAARIRAELVGREELEHFARSLANIEVNEIEIGGEIPSSITFFDLYGIQRLEELCVEERWKRSRTYESMRALIGQKSGNQPCYLDVHEKYHGPHGLVAGTTGSGKSETLQTYILSLTLNFSPYDVGLFIIDYKGGGMANLFNGLPYCPFQGREGQAAHHPLNCAR